MPDSDTATPIKKRRQGQRPTPEEKQSAQDAFLRAFAIAANVTVAAKAAGIDRATLYRWQEHDASFSARFHQAEAEANDIVRAEIFRRAVQGVDKPLHFQGRMVMEKGLDGKDHRVTVKEYSDTLLIFLAKARMPEFRERQSVEVSGPNGGPIQIAAIAANLERKVARYVERLEAQAVSSEPDA